MRSLPRARRFRGVIVAAVAATVLGGAAVTTGLASSTHNCPTVLAERPNTSSGWSLHACPTASWSETSARNDLINRLAATPVAWRDGLRARLPNTGGQTQSMDTAKVIQASPGNYLAVYATGNVINLATSSDLTHWTYMRGLDTSATQPYIAAGPNGSYLLADEKFDIAGALSGRSHLYFSHFASFRSLMAGQSDWFTSPPFNRALPGDRFFSLCNEGTPDIRGTSQANGKTVVAFGFHYNSHCGSPGPDREAVGTFQVTDTNPPTGRATATWSSTKDITRDATAASLGYTGSRGGRDDITWHGWRFSIQEAQCGALITADCTAGNANYHYPSWRYILYDYSDQKAYPVTIPPVVETVNGSVARCHGNPKITALKDSDGTAVLVVTGFIFGPPGGCVPSGLAGEFLYVVAAG